MSALGELVDRALDEDLGAGDITSDATVDAHIRARAAIVQKSPGVISGIDAAALAFYRVDAAIDVRDRAPEGVWRDTGALVLDLEGTARGLLAAERVALNLLGRLSGIATYTSRVVSAAGPTGPRVLDTRKTTPGLRALERQAVLAGGGVSHRAGLYDAPLIKENHIALAGGVATAVLRTRAALPDATVTVEVRNGTEIDAALAAGAHRLLLDNMTPEQVRAAVTRIAGRAVCEASGGIDLDTIAAYAAVDGLDFVSVGALTHSAPTLDLSLLLEALA